MIRILGTIFAGLLGLAFGSFLNVCLSRWPQGESVVMPASHCRTCGRTLRWWENIPLVSWLTLRGRCHGCGTWIGWRYPLVEAAVGGLWSIAAWRSSPLLLDPEVPGISPFLHFNRYTGFEALLGLFALIWFLVALAALDAEHLWLPDRITYPGIALGFLLRLTTQFFSEQTSDAPNPIPARFAFELAIQSALGILVAASLILAIRWIYWLLRRGEGIGLGDAKLMAMLAAWLGLPGALLSFGIGVVLGGVVGIIVLARGGGGNRSLTKLPLGTFLCIGGIVSAFWGPQLIHGYLRMIGLS